MLSSAAPRYVAAVVRKNFELPDESKEKEDTYITFSI